jgi:lysophospholipase L1-like esterase
MRNSLLPVVLLLAGCGSKSSEAPADTTPEDDSGVVTPAVDSGNPGPTPGKDAAVKTDAPATSTDAAPSGTPGVRLVGRYDESDPLGPQFDWPGVSIHANFKGTGVSIDLGETGGASEYAVFVDGQEQPKVVASKGARAVYPIATGLPDAVHEVLVWRRSEQLVGLGQFYGFKLDAGGTLLAPPVAKSRRIEVVGDSYTCGYGDEGAPGCTFSSATESNYKAYASVAARALDADLSTVAFSGKGMYRNYNDTGAGTDTMPDLYDYASITLQSPWDTKKFLPDVVVIYLGTNDSSTHGDPGQPYVDAYVSFVKHVRSNYANAWILCVIPTNLTADIANVLSAIKAGGDTKIDSVSIDSTAGGVGCDYHPDVVKQADMGQKLTTKLKALLSW